MGLLLPLAAGWFLPRRQASEPSSFFPVLLSSWGGSLGSLIHLSIQVQAFEMTVFLEKLEICSDWTSLGHLFACLWIIKGLGWFACISLGRELCSTLNPD